MTIKHIVINGGGPNMWYMYGALKHLHEKSIWNLENIESVYATSAGALLFTILVLINDWDDIDNSADCDDNASNRFPNADEVCDNIDNDCDNIIDNNAIDAITWYHDIDRDGRQGPP